MSLSNSNANILIFYPSFNQNDIQSIHTTQPNSKSIYPVHSRSKSALAEYYKPLVWRLIEKVTVYSGNQVAADKINVFCSGMESLTEPSSKIKYSYVTAEFFSDYIAAWLINTVTLSIVRIAKLINEIDLRNHIATDETRIFLK